jgi:uncharacterized integral membrane protein (TIGR00698 family)
VVDLSNRLLGLVRRVQAAVSELAPGLLASVVVALAAKFLSEHYGAPSMLMALLLGTAFHFLSEDGACVAGIEFASRTVLRVGVALLGARISVELLVGLGPPLILLVISGVAATIFVGLLGARLLGHRRSFGLLTAGAVAICGASAAMAIAAALPKRDRSEQTLIFTVLSVTVLGTIAMIFYPVLTNILGLDPLATGVFLGGTIHDVAQVVGAGFSVSEETGDAATLVKLIRVTMLAPVVLILSIAARGASTGAVDAQRPQLVPGFVIAFVLLAAINSTGVLPVAVVRIVTGFSSLALVTAIAAVGMKTAIRSIFDVGGQAIALIVGESLFLALWVLSGIWLLGA